MSHKNINRVIKTDEDDDNDIEIGYFTTSRKSSEVDYYDAASGEEERRGSDGKLKVPDDQLPHKVEESGKSKFYFASHSADADANAYNESIGLSDFYYGDETVLKELSKIICCYSSRYMSKVKFSKESKPDLIEIRGKAILTTYRLIFVPFKNSADYLSENCFEVDKKYQLLDLDAFRSSFVIPLTHINEIRMSINSSDKQRKLSSVSDLMISTPRDLTIKCKVKYISTHTFSLSSNDCFK